MTPYSTIVTVLLIAAIVAIVKLIIKAINLYDELMRSEQDADRYAKELAEVKTQLEKARKEIGSLNHFHIAATSDTLYKHYTIIHRKFLQDANAFHVVRFMPDGDHIIIKTFTYDYHDKEEMEHARIEAEDLLDALNGKVGWRVSKEDIGQSARTPDSRRGAKQ